MIIPFLVILVIGGIYRFWFTALPLSSGDWPYLFIENIKEFHFFPEIRFLWLAPYYEILTKIVVQYGGVPWATAEKIFWFLPFILLSVYCSYKLTKSPLGSLIYTTNTYALMIVGGGQMGVAMAYALAPLVLSRFINEKRIVTNGLLLSVQMMFDPRIALLTFILVSFYYVFQYHNALQLFRKLVVPIAITIILNLYWIVPLFRSELPLSQQLGEATITSARFLSFATFEQAISLLHPNWPENIFGKVYFMQPEFLMIAILAFSSLLFKPQNRKVLYFALMALVGAFLAKGTNQPFGDVYAWLFTHVPGFSLFRDPTKFYLFIALSFSLLIPVVIGQMDRKKITAVLFIIFWALTIRQALSGQLTGTFRPAEIPSEYVKLKDFINTQSQPFQTIWIPERQRFGFYSKLYPSLDARLLSGQSSISGILAWVAKEQTPKEFVKQRIKYIIIPYDSRGELFLTDRTYDEKLYLDSMDKISAVPWLRKVEMFSRIGVFEVQ